jgi:hypothetical protein
VVKNGRAGAEDLSVVAADASLAVGDAVLLPIEAHEALKTRAIKKNGKYFRIPFLLARIKPVLPLPR